MQCGEPLETEPQRILRLHVGVVVLEPLVDHGRARDAVALHAIGMLLQQVGDHQRAGLDASALRAQTSVKVSTSAATCTTTAEPRGRPLRLRGSLRTMHRPWLVAQAARAAFRNAC